MSSEVSKIFMTFLLCLLILLVTSCKTQAREFQQICSSSCGDIKNIGHPFRLKGDPEGCGYHEFELSCHGDKTILEISPGKYFVKRISYDENIITVVDANLANGSCSLPNNSLSPYAFYPIKKLIYQIEHVKYTYVSFLRCHRNITDQVCRKVPCLGDNQTNIYVTYDRYSVSDLPKSCTFISMVPVHLTHVENPTYEDIQKLLESGFDLMWSVVCRNCIATGDSCYRSYTSGLFYCDNPLTQWEIIKLTVRDMIIMIFLEIRLNPVLGPPVWVLISARFIFALIVLLVIIIHKYREIFKRVDNVEKFLHNQQSWIPKRYSYPEIIAMTNHFSHKLGQGGFGSVYKGQLHSGLLAVKMRENSKFSAEEFINEVSTIGRIHHVNVVRLFGFCSEESKRALVYEYMPNGSLDRHIFSKKGKGMLFSWEKLHEIALGTARGIKYLHEGCDVCILHFDIKPHNILLDHNLIPKVSDFGLAKFYPKENDFVSVSATRGTIGYIAPELISRNFGVVSCKSDVYSFGMLLLEMAGGRRNSNMNATRSSKAYFPTWAYERINNGGDLGLENVTEIESAIARKLCTIGLWCIQVRPADRPSMNKVVEMLEGSIDDLEMPPKPFFSSCQQAPGTGRDIESDSSTELLISESIEECSIADCYI